MQQLDKAHDRTRPTQFLAHTFWSKWLELGFPNLRLVRGADHLDADAPDEAHSRRRFGSVIDALHKPSAQLELFAGAPDRGEKKPFRR